MPEAEIPWESHRGQDRGEVKYEEATTRQAGGGNLHRGRGATAWGREEGGDDATEAGGGNLPKRQGRGHGATA